MSGAAKIGTGLTADQCARALIVSARRFGLDPLRVFTPHARFAGAARQMAACGVYAMGRALMSKAQAAALFGVHFSALEPSQMLKGGITVEDLMVVADAVRGSAPRAPRGGDAAVAAPASSRPEGRRAAPCPKPEARSPKPEARSPKPEARSPGVGPDRAAVKAADVRAGNPREGGGMRVRRVTPGVLEHAARMLDARWSLDETAAMFDVDPEALLAALEGPTT